MDVSTIIREAAHNDMTVRSTILRTISFLLDVRKLKFDDFLWKLAQIAKKHQLSSLLRLIGELDIYVQSQFQKIGLWDVDSNDVNITGILTVHEHIYWLHELVQVCGQAGEIVGIITELWIFPAELYDSLINIFKTALRGIVVIREGKLVRVDKMYYRAMCGEMPFIMISSNLLNTLNYY